MKKILMSLAACSVVLLGLISCKPEPKDEPHVAKTVDLRNKKNGTVSSLRAAGNTELNTEFSYELLPSVPRFIGENGVETGYSFWKIEGAEGTTVNPNDADFAKIKAAVKIEDHADGIKFTFSRPEGYTDKPFTWVNIQYLDDVGHKSTGIDFDANNNAEFLNSESIEVIYPLVDPYKDESRFWIQLAVENVYEAQLLYTITPIHGYGCVENVQEDYQIRDYLELSEESVMSVKLTIPPVAKELKHAVCLYAQSGSANQYTEKAGKPTNIEKMGVFEVASDEEIAAADAGKETAYTFDFVKQYKNLSAEDKAEVDAVLAANPYVWATLVYKYQVNVAGLEDYVFSTPWIISNVVKFTVPDAEE